MTGDPITALTKPQWPHRGAPAEWYGEDGDVCLDEQCDIYEKRDGAWHFFARSIDRSHTCPACKHTWVDEVPFSAENKRQADERVEQLRQNQEWARQQRSRCISK